MSIFNAGMDWADNNMAFFHTIQPEFQYEVLDDIEEYDADLELWVVSSANNTAYRNINIVVRFLMDIRPCQ